MPLSQKMYKCFRPLWAALTCAALASPVAAAAAHPHPHVISYGNRMTVKLFLGPEEDASTTIHVRSLMVDGKMREFVTGEAHEVTERLFVVRRAYRLNNNLPQDEGKVPSWVWERGGWLLVDRLTGHVSQVALVEFDPFYSQATWFRDYVAYCGVNDAGEKLSAVVMQLGRKKPVLHKELGRTQQDPEPDSECDAPTWEKKPTRVSFHPKHAAAQSFSIFGHAWDAAPGSDDQ